MSDHIATAGADRGSNGKAQVEERELFERHHADLRRSGLTDESIRAAGFYTETSPQEIATLLHWKHAATGLGNCLVIPYVDLQGNRTEYCRLKPDSPRTDKRSGKIIKYEAPCGRRNRAYFLPQSLIT